MKKLSLLCILFLSLGVTTGHAKKKVAPVQKGVSINAQIILIRNSIIALNNANMTGNYTTFRDLTAPAFRAKHNAAGLALIFTKIRNMKMNLAPIVLFNPVFTKKSVITKNGFLQLVGYIPTKPLQINFALTYKKIGTMWQIVGISVNPVKAVRTAKSKKGKRTTKTTAK